MPSTNIITANSSHNSNIQNIEYSNRPELNRSISDLSIIKNTNAPATPQVTSVGQRHMRNAIDFLRNKANSSMQRISSFVSQNSFIESIHLQNLSSDKGRDSFVETGDRGVKQSIADLRGKNGSEAKKEALVELGKNTLKFLSGSLIFVAAGIAGSALTGGADQGFGLGLGATLGPVISLCLIYAKGGSKIAAQDTLNVHSSQVPRENITDSIKLNAKLHITNKISLNFKGLGHRIDNNHAEAIANAYKINQNSEGAEKLEKIDVEGNKKLDENFVGNLVYHLVDNKGSIKDGLSLNLKDTNVYHGETLKQSIQSALQDADTDFDHVTLSEQPPLPLAADVLNKVLGGSGKAITATLTSSLDPSKSTSIQLEVSNKFNIDSTV